MKNLISVFTIFIIGFQLNAQVVLDEYVQEAANNNPGLKAKYTAFEASMQRAAQVSGLPDPTFTFGYFIQPVETRVGPQSARFSLSQMFPWFGTLSAKGDAAAAMAQASYYRFVDSREKLKLDIKTSYYQLWELKELITLENENLRILESYEKLATTRLATSAGKLSDVYRVQMQVEESRTRIKLLESRVKPLSQSFNRMLNRNEELEVVISDTIISPKLRIRMDSLTDHPAVHQYAEMKKAAQYQAVAAKKSGLPKIGLGLDYVIVNERSDMSVSDNGKDVVMPMVSLSLPIWRKSYSAAKKEAELLQDQYAFEADQAINEFESKLSMEEYELQSANDELHLYSSELSLVKKTLELTITDYTNDRTTFEEILRLQEKAILFKRQKLKAYKSYLNAMAAIEYLTFIP